MLIVFSNTVASCFQYQEFNIKMVREPVCT